MTKGNTQSRLSNVTKNMYFGLIAQALQMLLGLTTRTVFVKFLAVEYLGVNSLFSNILSMLSLAELGIGSAFIYSLYKPLADRDEIAIATIVNFFRKAYMFIGGFIFVTGLFLIPFLHQLIPRQPISIVEDIRLLYLIFLFNSASTYFFSYKISLLDADQKNSIATKVSTYFLLLQNLLQIIVLVVTKNFVLYLLIQLFCNLASNFFISRIVDKRYVFLKEHKTQIIDSTIKSGIIANAKATFLVKIGGVLVNGTDNLVINYFVGLTLLGKYSNYLMLVALGSNFLMILFANVKSSVANFVINESIEKQVTLFKALNFISFWMYGFCSILIILLINDFISIWIGSYYTLSFPIVVILAINFFMIGMQNSFWTFKVAYGFFEHGKYMVLITALINLILSFTLGYFFGIFGILLATAIARLVTNFWYDPYIVLKLGLYSNPIHYFKRFGKYVLILIVSSFFVYLIGMTLKFSLPIIFVLKFILSLVFFNGLIYFVYRNQEEFLKVKDLFSNVIVLLFKKST